MTPDDPTDPHVQESGPPPIPEWVPFDRPGDAHHAAFAAYLHARTRALLLRFWRPCEASPGDGCWDWELRHPGSGWVAHLADHPDDPNLVLLRASTVIADVVAGIKRLG